MLSFCSNFLLILETKIEGINSNQVIR